MWNQRIDSTLKKMGFKSSDADPCLYVRTRRGKTSFILLYVDDMLVACSNQEEYEEISTLLGREFNLTELGEVHSYLGIEIKKRGNNYYLNQTAYIRQLAERFGMQEAKCSRIPMDPGYIQQKEEGDRLPNNEMYQSLIGGLLYLAVTTRPDIAVSTSILGRRVSKPTSADWTEAKRVLRYLIGTSDLMLCLGGGEQILEGFSDADWAGEAKDRKSTSGYLYRLDGGLVLWGAKKQTCVALSSTEAEYVSLSICCQELEWFLRLLESFGERPALPVKIWEDNQSSIKLLQQDDYTKRSKHVDTRYHYTRDLMKKGKIDVQYCPTTDMLADMLTKPLNRIKLENFRSRIGLIPY